MNTKTKGIKPKINEWIMLLKLENKIFLKKKIIKEC